MTKKARRFLLLVIVVSILFSTGVFLVRKLTLYTYTELSVTFKDGEEAQAPLTAAEPVSVFSSTVRNASYMKQQPELTDKAPDLTVSAFSNTGKAACYSIYIVSIFKRTAYLQKPDGRIYRLTAQDFTNLFSLSDFSPALGNEEPLPVILYSTAPGSTMALAAHGYPFSGTWNYATANGTQNTSEISAEKSRNYYVFSDISSLFTLYTENMPSELMPLRILTDNGEEVLSILTDGKNIPNPGKDGYYIYELTVKRPTVADIDYNGSVVYYFNIRIDAPASPQLSTDSVRQGEVVAVRIADANTVGTDTSENDTFTAACSQLDWTGSFTTVNGVPTALLGIPMTAEPGVYNVDTIVNGTPKTLSLTVTEGDFPSQNLTISTTVKASWTEEQEKYLTPLRQYISSENYITGIFTPPAEGKITTAFGTFRYTNNATEPTRHNGTDIANKTMPDVLSPMGGKVVFTGELKLTGNTVVVDHGMNVLSYFYHLDSVSTEEGQILKTGDKIGVMGTTGYSTGVHLHYTVMVDGVAVNPEVFYNTDFTAG